MDARFRQELLQWYRHNGRDLPWRRRSDPYAIWVSEIMLQQTQVATVLRYYQPFLDRFPDVASLARAAESEVLKAWEGLGYYRRARHMHQAARRIVREHGGQFPRDMPQLQALPGIGRYTAAAIASLAFGAREPILEANTRRLYARLMACAEDLSSARTLRKLWAFGQSLLPEKPDQCRSFNQALMDLGALVCKPANPSCAVCPVASWCRALAQGKQDQIPVSGNGVETEVRWEAVVALCRGDRWLLRQCEAQQRWSGLWDFVRFPLQPGPPLEQQVTDACRHHTGYNPEHLCHIASWRHSITRFRITLECFMGQVAQRHRPRDPWRWVQTPRLEQLPLNVTARRLARLLANSLPAR